MKMKNKLQLKLLDVYQEQYFERKKTISSFFKNFFPNHGKTKFKILMMGTFRTRFDRTLVFVFKDRCRQFLKMSLLINCPLENAAPGCVAKVVVEFIGLESREQLFILFKF